MAILRKGLSLRHVDGDPVADKYYGPSMLSRNGQTKIQTKWLVPFNNVYPTWKDVVQYLSSSQGAFLTL